MYINSIVGDEIFAFMFTLKPKRAAAFALSGEFIRGVR